MTHIDTKTENVKKLYELHEIAIEMRYAGNTYEDISKFLTEKFGKNHTPAKVRRWFQSGGMLDKPYFDFAKKENERRRAYMMERMKSVIDIVPDKIIKVLNRVAVNPFTGEILKNEDGSPMEKLDKLTIAALQLVMNALGVKVSAQPGDTDDPMEDFRQILREERERETNSK